MSAVRHRELEAVAGPVSRETFDRLCAFEATFRKWSQRINLAAPSTLETLWRRHVLDSAQLFPLAPQALRWLDLGSGGGFPGVILAILLRERPNGTIDLVESTGKKVSFLQTALREAQAPGRVHRCRIQAIAGAVPQPEIVTARALAPLDRLITLAEPWLGAGARGLFHKGRDYLLEIEESRDHWQFDLVEHPDRVDPQGIILEVANPVRR